MHWFHGFGIAWTWLAWLAILGAVVWLALWAIRSGLGAPHDRRETAEEILKRRYAAGEIDDAEYERRLAELRR
jgi:putative membrane protein